MRMNTKGMERALAMANVVAKRIDEARGKTVEVSIRDGKMRVQSAFMSQAGIRIDRIPVKADKEVAFVIDAVRMHGVMKKIPSEEFDMTVNGAVVMKSGRLKYSIPPVADEDSGNAEPPPGRTFRIMCDDLVKAMKKVVPSTDTMDTNGPYAGVHVRGRGKVLWLSASDRKSVVHVNVDIMPSEDFTAVVPRELLDYLQVFDPEKFLDMRMDKRSVAAAQEDIRIWCGLLAGDFRDMSEEVMRESVKARGDGTLTRVCAGRKKILDLLSRMEVIAEKDGPKVRIRLEAGAMEMSCESRAGTCTDSCEVEGGADRTVSVNPNYLRRILHPLSADKVEIEFFKKYPLIFIESEDDRLKAFCAGIDDTKEGGKP